MQVRHYHLFPPLVIILYCRSWQVIQFEPLPVTFVKIVGTHNTANEVCHTPL